MTSLDHESTLRRSPTRAPGSRRGAPPAGSALRNSSDAPKARRRSSASHATPVTVTPIAQAPIPTPPTPTKPTPGQLVERIDRYLEDLAGTLEHGPSERFLALLRSLASFHRYSAANWLLILLQRPTASRVAGYQQWESMGYPVQQGQKGLMILVPVTVKQGMDEASSTTSTPPRSHKSRKPRRQGGVKGAAAEPVEAHAALPAPTGAASVPAAPVGTPDASASATTRKGPASLTRFIVRYVFDVSQLDPEAVAQHPLPTFFYALGDDAQTEALCSRLVTALTRTGIVVEACARAALEGAEACSYGGRIAYCDDLDSHRRLLALIHEAAHELLHKSTPDGKDGVARPRALRELEAESTSYAVAAYLGVDHPFAADYLLMYHNNAAALRLLVNRVRDATVWMLGLLDLDSVAGVPIDRTAPKDSVNDSVGERVLCPPPFAVVPSC